MLHKHDNIACSCYRLLNFKYMTSRMLYAKFFKILFKVYISNDVYFSFKYVYSNKLRSSSKIRICASELEMCLMGPNGLSPTHQGSLLSSIILSPLYFVLFSSLNQITAQLLSLIFHLFSLGFSIFSLLKPKDPSSKED